MKLKEFLEKLFDDPAVCFRDDGEMFYVDTGWQETEPHEKKFQELLRGVVESEIFGDDLE